MVPAPDHHRLTYRRLPVQTVPLQNGQLAAQCGRLLAPLRALPGAMPVRCIRGSASHEGLAAAIDSGSVRPSPGMGRRLPE